MRTSRSSVAAVLAVTFFAFALTITPSSQDWGDAVVKSRAEIRGFTISGIADKDSALAILTGPDMSHWTIDTGNDKCRVNKADGTECSIEVGFVPKSIGPKTATLVVRDYHGNRVTAQLKGKGIEALCEMKVVFCNFAHMYKGVFSWQEGLAGPTSSTTIQLQADIDGLNVACNGTETVTQEGRAHVMTSTGPGLVAVEFKVDDTMRPVYHITVACPSPGDSDTPSRPAELGDFEQESYDQQKTIPDVPIVPGVNLVGSSSYPNPANDELNGVTGTVVVKWNLKRK